MESDPEEDFLEYEEDYDFDEEEEEEENVDNSNDNQLQSDVIAKYLLPGERIKYRVHSVGYTNIKLEQQVGTLLVTNFRLIFTVDEALFLDIPNLVVWKLRRGPGKVGKITLTSLDLQATTKDGRLLTFTFPDELQLKEGLKIITSYVFPPSSRGLFAFTHGHHCANQAETPVYDPLAEYTRLGMTSNGFRVTEINKDYALCKSYPQVLIVPERISDEDLKLVAQFRSRGRIPVCIWRHPTNFSTITRCSQPLVGLKRNGCLEDVQLLSLLRNTGQTHLFLLDSRPKTNAMANSLKGGGYEQASVYKDCFPVEFQNIENIHAMRSSLQKLYKICLDEKPHNNKQWKATLEETKWLEYLKIILLSSLRVVELIQAGNSVLIHCSDGWDRTTQTVALSELLLDPHYRSLEGFILLIEKEWLSFGHQFARRIGHGAKLSDPNDSQRSPIFLQFVDAVYQLTQQHPNAFEFNEKFLITMLDHVYSCLYGTFLMDCEHQRQKASVKTTTISFWSYILANRKTFIQRNYRQTNEVLSPVITNLTVCLWNEYYLRWNPYFFTEQQQTEMMKERTLMRQLSSNTLRGFRKKTLRSIYAETKKQNRAKSGSNIRATFSELDSLDYIKHNNMFSDNEEMEPTCTTTTTEEKKANHKKCDSQRNVTALPKFEERNFPMTTRREEDKSPRTHSSLNDNISSVLYQSIMDETNSDENHKTKLPTKSTKSQIMQSIRSPLLSRLSQRKSPRKQRSKLKTQDEKPQKLPLETTSQLDVQSTGPSSRCNSFG